jgi:molybdopterin-guanine dinucleotide biosynthesis protein A
VSVTGIVLAGGRSSRFGSDKLAEPLDLRQPGQPRSGATLLAAAIAAVASLSDGVIVAGPALPEGAAARDVSIGATDVPIALVRDPEPFGGPLVALAHVLATDSAPIAAPDRDELAIVVAGDMPRLLPAVLTAMVEALLGSSGTDAVYLGRSEAAIGTDQTGPPPRQVLPLAIRVQPVSRAAREAVAAGQRSLQALLDRIAAVELPASSWRHLDPDGLTLLDVDTPADLDRLRGR